MSKRIYTPSLEELDRQHGECYYTVSVGKRHRPHAAAFVFGTLEEIISTIDATIYGIDPEADPAEYSATISTGTGTELVRMPDCAGPDSATVCPQPAGDTYEIRQVDAWAEYDDPDDPDEIPAWTYNETWNLGTFTTTGDPARAFRRALARLGITFHRGRTRTEYDGDVYEIVDRATGEPLFAAVPRY